MKRSALLNFKIKGFQVQQADPPVRESTSLNIRITIYMGGFFFFLSVLIGYFGVYEYIISLVDFIADK